MSTDSGQDVRALLGMRTKAAWTMVGLLSFSLALMAGLNLNGVDHAWLIVCALLLATAGAVSLIVVPGDPLPLIPTLLLTAIGPTTAAMVVWQLPVPDWNGQQAWPPGAATAIYTYMCVRGRTGYAWLGTTAVIVVFAYWTATTGQGVERGIGHTIINYAPLLMATVFAYTIRPAAASVFALRGQATRRAAAEAASTAALHERDRQLDALDQLARPLLELIASGAELMEQQLVDCRLLEAQLRDSLRARALAVDAVIDSARSARSRGVQVVLLDDHGMDHSEPATQARVLGKIAQELDQADEGKVTVRIQPPGRTGLATILIANSTGTRRLQIDHDGDLEHTAANLMAEYPQTA